MAVFKYITKGVQSLQGKQKIYFCAHPVDYDLYFEMIKNDILNTLENNGNTSCAILYLENPSSERDEEFLFNLKEMNLIVMPVTRELLTTANPALDTEFRFAIEKHIPVLPVLMESGLAELFNMQCGAIQYLDPFSRDQTTISYREKLTKFLTSVLIGDEIAEKIRNAFDAYIFLSYRKKDRQHAQKLMRLIHKNDFCRDIAIWYDEFLTPGENFNDSIKDALAKSQLFALAVTPSLLEKSKDKNGNECENYIVTTEYPMAQKAKKKILPAELIDTDKNELAKKYKNIPACINTEEEQTFSTALLTSLESIALRENDNDPEHNFFIGLAYLGGIDVEKDADRALELITSAAEAGLPEAMEKLVSIYRNGEITSSDYITATEWQKKLVNTRKIIYEETRSENSAKDYLKDLENLGTYLYELRNYDFAAIIKKYSGFDASDHTKEFYHIIDAKSTYEEMYSASTEAYNRFQQPCFLQALSSSCCSIGDMNRHLRNYEAAETYYLKSLEITEELQKQKNSSETEYAVLLCHKNLGDFYNYNYNKWNYAEKHYLIAIDIYKNISVKTKIDVNKYYISHIYYSLGFRYQYSDKPADSEKYYFEASILAKEILAENDNFDIKDYLWQILIQLGDVCVINDHLAKAQKAYLDALAIIVDISNLPHPIETITLLSTNYEKLSNIYQKQGLYEDAKVYYQKLVEKKEEYTKKYGTTQSKRELSICCREFGKYAYYNNDIGFAEECYLKSLKTEEELAQVSNTNEAYDSLAGSYFDAGFCVSLEQKKKYWNKSIEIWTLLSENDPNNPKYIFDIDYVKKISANVSKPYTTKCTSKISFLAKLFKKRNN